MARRCFANSLEILQRSAPLSCALSTLWAFCKALQNIPEPSLSLQSLAKEFFWLNALFPHAPVKV
jgi:hypothetical protein